MKKQNQISEKSYKASGFIGRYQKLVTETVIPWQEKILWDEAPDTEKSHAIANFINAGKAPETVFTAWSSRTAMSRSGSNLLRIL